ncbi:MAG: hypothetical protein UIH18_02785 [Fibrobacteraceae bacterium]|nr:hypothetical protein [Fibrobacteraceae bacterium]
MKKILLSFLGVACFVACSDSDSSPSGFAMDDSFEIVLDKATYEYIADKKDTAMVVYNAVCKEGTLGNLVWKEKTEKGDTLQVSFNSKKKIVSTKNASDEEWGKFDYEGSVFPLGLWKEGEDAVMQYAMKFASKQEMQLVFAYSGSCFLEDYYKGLEESELEDTEVETDEGMESMIPVAELEVRNCSEATMYDGLVTMKIESLKESSGNLSLIYKSKRCPISFSLRYAKSESDCKAAYDEFLLDKEAEEFDFDEYSVVLNQDEYCIAELMLALHKDLGVPLSEGVLQGKVVKFAKTLGNLSR